jgi:hypothetical protein
MIAFSKLTGANLPFGETSGEERDTGSVEAAEVQRVDQTEVVLDTRCPYESSITVAGRWPSS